MAIMNVTKAIRVARISHVGMLREHNEDAVASDMSIGLVLLADGMGGYKAGEVASEVAVLLIAAEMTEAMHNQSRLFKTEPDLLPESNMLINAVEKTNKAIYEIAQLQPECAGMGTTLVAGVFANDTLVLGHIGDSRMYRLRGDTFEQLTEDHSLVQEQINAGLITVEQAKVAKNKNLVTRALGIDPMVELELQELAVEVGDKYLLCSDGLSDLLSDAEIAQVLLDEKEDIDSAVEKLVEKANHFGGLDNISVVIITIEKSFKAEKSWVKRMLKVKAD
jgi:serine/threonine protein phosphatase PrpC